MASVFSHAAMLAGLSLLDALAIGRNGQASVPPGRPRHPGLVGLRVDERRSALASLSRSAVEAALGTSSLVSVIPPSRCQAREEEEAASAVRQFAFEIGVLAARMLVLNDEVAARAAVEGLREWAQMGAPPLSRHPPLDDRRVAATRLALAPLTIAYGFLCQENLVTAGDRTLIERWLDRLRRRADIGEARIGSDAPRSYHRIAADLAAMTLGCLRADRTLFDRGVQRYFVTLAQMRADGSWPEASGHGPKALWMHTRSLAGLVTLAELARFQEIDLYDAWSGGRSLHRAVDCFARCLETEPVRYPGAGWIGDAPAQALGFLSADASGRHACAWVETYLGRFGQRAEAERLRAAFRRRAVVLRRPLIDELSGGHATALFGGLALPLH